MNRHLIWIIAGTSVLGLGVPALAAGRSDGSPDDNGVPGEVRGNCDEAEHASDPNCRAVVVPGEGAIVVTVPSTAVTIPSTPPVSRSGMPSKKATDITVPDITVPSNTAAARAVPAVPVAGAPAANAIGDVSGPCDEAEHASDPRCTGNGDDDTSGHGEGSGSIDDDIDDIDDSDDSDDIDDTDDSDDSDSDSDTDDSDTDDSDTDDSSDSDDDSDDDDDSSDDD